MKTADSSLALPSSVILCPSVIKHSVYPSHRLSSESIHNFIHFIHLFLVLFFLTILFGSFFSLCFFLSLSYREFKLYYPSIFPFYDISIHFLPLSIPYLSSFKPLSLQHLTPFGQHHIPIPLFLSFYPNSILATPSYPLHPASHSYPSFFLSFYPNSFFLLALCSFTIPH